MPANYTDLFNTALDDLTDFLQTTLNLQVVNDPRKHCSPVCDDRGLFIRGVEQPGC
jgi:hypothetical protein